MLHIYVDPLTPALGTLEFPLQEAIPTGRDLERPVPPNILYIIVSLLFPDRP